MRCFIGNPFEDQYVDDSGDELEGIEGDADVQRINLVEDILVEEIEVGDDSSDESYVPEEDHISGELFGSFEAWDSFDEDFHGYPTNRHPEFSDSEDEDDLEYVTYPNNVEEGDISVDGDPSWPMSDSDEYLSDYSIDEPSVETQSTTKNTTVDNLNSNNTSETTDNNVADSS